MASRVLPPAGALAAKRPSMAESSPSVDAVGRHQPHHAQAFLGERAGLVQADHVGRRQRLHGVELLAERAAPRHPPGGDRVGERGQQHQALGDDRDHARPPPWPPTRGTGVSCSISDQPSSSPSGTIAALEHQDQPVERQLEGRARVAELARLAHQALGVRVGADGLARVGARALDGSTTRRAGGRPAARETASASPVRIDSSSPSPSLRSTRPSATTWSPAPTSTRSPGTTSGTSTSIGLAVPHHRRPRRDQGGQPVEAPLRAGLLHDPDARVQDQDRQEDRVPPVGEDQRDDAEEDQDHVEDGQQVGPQDAGPRAAGGGALDLPPRGQPAPGLGLGEALLGAGAGRGAMGRRADGGRSGSGGQRLRDGALTTCPSRTLTPGRSSSSEPQRAGQALLGDAHTRRGRVALPSARVDVTGTAPGMFATQ